ncbi:MAG: hypothetical protein ACXVHB_06085 [Solirubrobacteraceae bacterium]
MTETHDRIIESLRAERSELEERVAALDAAIGALEGTAPGAGTNGRRRPGGTSVGDDKLDAVRRYIKRRGKVRQAEITHELGFNSGTVSTATHALMIAGEIERGPKEDRSTTWRAVK